MEMKISNEERFIYPSDEIDKKSFSYHLSIDEFNNAFEKGRIFEIEANIPESDERIGIRKAYVEKLQLMKHYLSLSQDEEIKKIRDIYKPKFYNLDEEIKKLESLIYVEELLVIKIVYEKKDGNIIAKQQNSDN
jgi:hypothetical protein